MLLYWSLNEWVISSNKFGLGVEAYLQPSQTSTKKKIGKFGIWIIPFGNWYRIRIFEEKVVFPNTYFWNILDFSGVYIPKDFSSVYFRGNEHDAI